MDGGAMLQKILRPIFLTPAAAIVVLAAASYVILQYAATRQALQMRQLDAIRSTLDYDQQALGKATASNENPAEIKDLLAAIAVGQYKYDEIEKGEANLRNETRNATISIGVTLMVALTITFVLGYLRPSERSFAWHVVAPNINKLSEELADLRKLVAAEREAGAGFDKDELLSSLRSSVAGDLAQELMVRFRADAQENLFSFTVREMYGSDCERLFAQIALLRKRGNLNLALGVAITLLASGVLVWTLPPASSALGKTTEVLSYYIPRISTIAFIEVFAFFFLRLYKTTLAEEKFYQNELTSRTARQTALEAALLSKNLSKNCVRNPGRNMHRLC
jgi:hypothetical protein